MRPVLSSAPLADAVGTPMTCGARALFGAVGEQGFAGFVIDPEDLTRRHVVELLVDGVPTQVMRADLFHPVLAEAGIGDGCYGFHFHVPALLLASAARFEGRLANVEEHLPATEAPIPPGEAERGNVEWLGGLHFRGWMRRPRPGENPETPRVLVSVDGVPVRDVPADLWAGALADGLLQPVRGFDIELPDTLADGRVHHATFVVDGQMLGAGATAFLALATPLSQILADHLPQETGGPAAEAVRVELFDTLFPPCLPFAQYDAWRAALPALPAASELGESDRVALVFLGDEGLDASLAALNGEPGHWVAGALPSDVAKAAFDPTPLSAFMAGDAHDSVAFAFLPAGARLHPGALARIGRALQAHPRAIMLFADVDVEENDGRVWPLAFPAADYERSLEQGFAGRCFVLRATALRTAMKRGASTIFRLANFIYDFHPLPPGAIVHLPGPLACLPAACLRQGHAALNRATAEHLAATKQDSRQAIAIGECLPALRVARAARRELVSLVVDAASYPALAERCLKAALPALRRIDGELIVILPPGKVNATLEPLLKQMSRVKALQRPDPRSTATFNTAISAAEGKALIFLAGAMMPGSEDWLDELRCRLDGRDAGAVAPVVVDAADRICDAGYVLGPGFEAVRAFTDRQVSDPGYGDMLRVAHEVGALSFDCVAFRPAMIRELGGQDGMRFPLFFGGIDLSLRLRAKGLRLVLTPNAVLRDLGPGRIATSDLGRSPLAAARARELRTLRARWGEVLADDPLFSPILARAGASYGALCWPAVRPAPRISLPPQPRDWPLSL
ncbi:hypothetical protein V5F77_09160 [Xanthobacter sp. DSM 24535]|uniref:glycosyltransferase family 2 protein n=1 Tax=Roseixanthobacter psychrophilus TaxID=3119917 RepID=UPI0037293BC6